MGPLNFRAVSISSFPKQRSVKIAFRACCRTASKHPRNASGERGTAPIADPDGCRCEFGAPHCQPWLTCHAPQQICYSRRQWSLRRPTIGTLWKHREHTARAGVGWPERHRALAAMPTRIMRWTASRTVWPAPESRRRRCQLAPSRHGPLARLAERVELVARWLASGHPRQARRQPPRVG